MTHQLLASTSRVLLASAMREVHALAMHESPDQIMGARLVARFP